MHTLFPLMPNLALSVILTAIFLYANDSALAAPADLSPDLPNITAQSGFPNDGTPGQPSTSTPEGSGIRGLLSGSLLGKLLFDQPFERASLIDIIAILFLAFIISKLITRPGSGRGFGSGDDGNTWGPEEGKKSGPAAPPAGFDPWARLGGNSEKKPHKGKTIPFPGTEHQEEHSQPETCPPDSAQPEVYMESNPEDNEFIKGAKLIYVRLHEAWKKQDLEFIEHFTSPHIYQRYLQMNKEDYLDIVKVDARVLKEGSRNGAPFVTVEFTALAHKSKQAGPPSEVKETWSFLEPASTGSWRLEEKD